MNNLERLAKQISEKHQQIERELDDVNDINLKNKMNNRIRPLMTSENNTIVQLQNEVKAIMNELIARYNLR